MTTAAPDMLTVREVAKSLGLKPVTVRRAYREGRLTGRRYGSETGWSFLMIDPQSVETYRTRHLGRRGPVATRCTTCHRPFDKHDSKDHDFARDPRAN